MPLFRISTLVVALLVAAACAQSDEPPPVESTVGTMAAAAVDEERVITIDTTLAPLATYVGDLPCEDCEAVRTELTLWADPHRYLLTETFIGHAAGDSTQQRLGEWISMRGYPGDPDGRLLQLRLETAGDPLNFAAIGGDGSTPADELRMLDPAQQDLPNGDQWTLRRQ